MRVFLTTVAALSLMATPALAGHDHNEMAEKPAETTQVEHDRGMQMPAAATDALSKSAHEHMQPMGDEMKAQQADEADDHSAHGAIDHGAMDHSKLDHSKMDHGAMAGPELDNSNMDHSNMDHANMDHADKGHDGHMMGSKTMPADGAVLDHSPEKIGVNFGHAMNLDAVVISTLTGEMIELDVSEIGETAHVMLDAPDLQPDDYIVDCRARGADGHIMSGSFAFTVE